MKGKMHGTNVGGCTKASKGVTKATMSNRSASVKKLKNPKNAASSKNGNSRVGH